MFNDVQGRAKVCLCVLCEPGHHRFAPHNVVCPTPNHSGFAQPFAATCSLHYLAFVMGSFVVALGASRCFAHGSWCCTGFVGVLHDYVRLKSLYYGWVRVWHQVLSAAPARADINPEAWKNWHGMDRFNLSAERPTMRLLASTLLRFGTRWLTSSSPSLFMLKSDKWCVRAIHDYCKLFCMGRISESLRMDPAQAVSGSKFFLSVFLFILTGALATREKSTFFAKLHPHLPVFCDGPILTGWSCKHFFSVCFSFSRAKRGALACYGCSDEQCSTPRARCVWCWGGGWGGAG